MSIVVNVYSGCNEEYVTPVTEVVAIESKASLLGNSNENTGEENLF
jgi:hypothetical protein